ncbi:MAG: glycosyltransferase N-terminal domain-containing protein [Pseudomonadota bacterium]
MNNIRSRATLEAYRLAGQASLPLLRARYAQRVRDGLEQSDRVQEHFGYPSKPREAGNWVWFHAGNADEVRSLLPLVRLCTAQDLMIIATSTSRYGLELWETEAEQNPSVVAQYAPVDVERCANRFLDHWKPDLAITVADQVWPLITSCLKQRRISCVVVGGVLSQRCHDFWSVRPMLARRTFRHVEFVAATDATSADAFRDLGACDVEVCGDLAFDAPINTSSSRVEQSFWDKAGLDAARPTWLAVPANADELALCLEAQRALQMAGSPAVCLLSPPPSMSVASLRSAVEVAGLNFGAPTAHTDEAWAEGADILLVAFGADGERAAVRSQAIYLGGAFGKEQAGGLSPVPAILHRLAIASGEKVERHVSFLSQLHRDKAVRIVGSSEELAGFLSIILNDPTAQKRMTDGALSALWSRQGAVNTTYIALDRYLRPLAYKARMENLLPVNQAAE